MNLHLNALKSVVFLLSVIFVSLSPNYAQTPFSCTGLVYQVSGINPKGNVSLYSFNINTGVRTEIAPLGLSINAIGYNAVDNMIWGYDQNNNKLVSIDALGAVTAHNIDNLPKDVYNSADFLPGGYLLFYRTDTGTLTDIYYVVDLNPSRAATYLKLVDPTQLGFPLESAPFGSTMSQLTLTNDMAYNPTSGLLVGLGTGLNIGKIVSLNPSNGNVAVNATRVTGDGIESVTGAFGAAFVDAGNSNILYVFSNGNGSFYRVNLTTNTATKISSSIPAGNNDGASCPSAIISFPISGNVFHDVNGLKDATVNGPGTNVGGALYAVLYNNTTGRVEGIDPVGSNGVFNFGATPDNAYTVYLTTTPDTLGHTSVPTISLPAGWVNTGETLGTAPGNDLQANGTLTIGTVNAPVINANFGIEQLPESAIQSYVLATQPSVNQFLPLDGTVPNAQPLMGSDPEDMPANGNMTGKTIRIDSLPTHGELYYDGKAVAIGTVIENLDPAKLQLKLTGSAYTSTSFKWSHLDSAGQPDPTPGTYTLSWVTPLPVLLTYFEATKEGRSSMLHWRTSEESKSDYFGVERSGDGRNWYQIGMVKAYGESQVTRNYKYQDESPLSGRNLYRLKMVDNDGSFEFSRMTNLTFGRSTQAYVYPNPTTDRVRVEAPNLDLSKVRNVTIHDVNGKMLRNQTSLDSQGLDVSRLQNGVYFIRISLNSGTVQELKFVIAK